MMGNTAKPNAVSTENLVGMATFFEWLDKLWTRQVATLLQET